MFGMQKKSGGNIKRLVSYSSEEMKQLKSKTDWERVRNMKDEDIDFSDIPELTDEMASRMVRYSYGKPIVQLPSIATVDENTNRQYPVRDQSLGRIDRQKHTTPLRSPSASGEG